MGVKKKISSKPKLLIILNRFVIGGQAVDTIPLAYYLKDYLEILILFGEKEKDEIEPAFLLEKYPGLTLQKISYLRRSINPLVDVIAFFRLLFTIKKFDPHIVHTHGAKSGFLGRLSAWMIGVPIVVHTFHGHFFHSYFSKTISNLIAVIERGIGKITTAAVALSDTQKRELVEQFKILPATKINIIPLGFNFDEDNDINAFRNSFRKKYGLQQSDIAIGIVGRVVPVKNHSLFVRVAKSILSTDLSSIAAFFIIGDGELRKEVEKEFQKQQISYNDQKISATNRVVFTSWITNMYEVMNGLDIIALTSLNEGTPLSIIEAEFFKKPVISTNVGGVKDTMINGETGFLIEGLDLTFFSNKLEQLIKDESLRFKMGEAGSKLASRKFSKQNEVLNTKEFYFSLLQQKGFLVDIQ